MVGLYTNFISVSNSRIEEFERLNAHSKKVNVPLEKTTYVHFYHAPATAKPQKIKVRGWGHPQFNGEMGRKELMALPICSSAN